MAAVTATTGTTRPTARPAACRSPTAASSVAQVTLADGTQTELDHGHVVIAAITSCTNTSNPTVMLAAGLLARNAVQRGLQVKPWVKTSPGPGLEGGHRVPRAGRPGRVPRRARLQPRRLRLHDLHRQQRAAAGRDLRRASRPRTSSVVSVLSGNRNFEGRINPDIRMNYLASPPLVVAYALAGTMDIDLTTSRSARTRTASRSTSRTSGPDPAPRSRRRSSRRFSPTCSARATTACSTATSAGTRSRSPPARSSRGTSARPTCAGPRSSRTCRASPSR